MAKTSGDQVTSPVAGTLYVQRDPNGEPFVRLGSTVKRGDVICLIEAIGVMNQVTAVQDGVVRAGLVENGTPVDFGQMLFIIN